MATSASKTRQSSRQAPRRQGSSRTGSHRQASSMALMQQKLAEMGSYSKYYKAVTQNPFQVKIRCACGRSRNMAWMFLCTWCATGRVNQSEDDQKDTDNKAPQQRGFLSCDLCANKMTESYYCPHCLAAYPAHYVKFQNLTRCSRCVSCPVCISPLEKIVYSGGSSKESSSSSSSSSSTLTPAASHKKDVYLYQCPFCFWSSNIVKLEASESEALLEKLKTKLRRPMEEKSLIMNEIKTKYLTCNEDLRKEEERIQKAKRIHTYRGGRAARALYSSSSSPRKQKSSSSNKYSKNKLSIASIPDKMMMKGGHGRQPSMQSVDTLNALETLKKKLRKKFELNHVLNQKSCSNTEPPLDQRYVSQFHLRNVSPLEHRLNDPLNQSVDMDKYVPQRFHLMTKESYKCPVKNCNKYVCKPTLRGRQANYDKRTAVLDYLPRINIRMKSGNLMTMTKSEIVVMVQNRHLSEATFHFDASVNENLQNDLYSTAKISCSSQEFTIDPADIHIKGGHQRDKKYDDGNYVKGKEAGITVVVEPKHYSTGPRNVKFSILCAFKTKLRLKDDKSVDREKKEEEEEKKTQQIDVDLPYILDFDLGPAKTPNVDVYQSDSVSKKEQKTKPMSSQHKSRKSNEDLPKNGV